MRAAAAKALICAGRAYLHPGHAFQIPERRMNIHEPTLDRAQRRKSAGSGDGRTRWTMKARPTAGSIYAALIIVLSAWVLHSFLEALLAACVTAIASWPLYRKFAACLPPRTARSVAPLVFTAVMTVFVLAPLMFALGALLTEAHALLLEIAAADREGIAIPLWLQDVPAAGPWLVASWESRLAGPGALSTWLQRTDPAALMAGANSLGHFVARHLLIVLFTILVLFFLYQEGESLAQAVRRVLRDRIGERAEGYVDVATRSLRASVSSMLVVGLFDGFACSIAYALAGARHAGLWAAITGALALVPFLGYTAVAALAMQLAVSGATTPALFSLALGCLVLFCGDKIVRPMIAHSGTNLPFVWVLMGCLGGFEVLGLVGLVVGPVLLALTRELWEERMRALTLAGAEDASSPSMAE
jgi:predicted PurR-regulated permease PerM